MNEFFCKTKIISGSGAVAALGQMHIRRLFLVCDPFFAKNGTADAVVKAANPEDAHIFSQVVPDPSVTLAAQGAAAVREFQPDTIVALGGGSAMDSAKAMAYFSGLQPYFVAIPTTSGSGSEVTNFAILTHEGVKHPLVDDRLRPDAAILDSRLTQSLPPALIAEGGFDLVSHAVEAYAASGAGALSDTLAQQALKIALKYLPASFGGDTAVRLEIHNAATMAGIAFSCGGLGLCHAISHSLGGEFHIPHGRLNAILLPAVMEQNATGCLGRYAALSRNLGLTSGSDMMAFRALKNALLRLRRNLQLPETLAQCGITLPPDKVEKLVDAALADPCCATNPVRPSREMVRAILREVNGHG